MAVKSLPLAVTVLWLFSGSVFAHSDGHQLTEAELKAAGGVFADSDVRDRQLSDWEGIWQSVYPLLQSGELDPVFRKKVEAEKPGGKTVEQIKAYYTAGYKTATDKIEIENNVMTFYTGAAVASCHYRYDGFEILHYASGKKGVRYLFTCQDKHSKAPEFVQFSDHIIAPRKSSHFHIFTGNISQAVLLKEMDNWPTYYPEQLYNHQIVEEMLHH